MPNSGNKERLSNRKVLQLFRKGYYWADLDEGAVYSQRTNNPIHIFRQQIDGRPWVRLFSDNKRRSIQLNRLIWMAGNMRVIPHKFEVHHIDHDFNNNAFGNLVALSPLDHAKMHAIREELLEDTPF